MKLRNLSLIIFSFFALQSCDQTEAYFGGSGNGNTPGNFSRLSEVIKHENVQTDSLSFNPNEASTLTGAFGVEISIPANAVERSGTALPDELFVVLREYPNLQKMALSNVQTESNQEMLVTGGNFWWKIVDAEGNDWNLTQPSQVTATQPVTLNMGSYAAGAGYYSGDIITANNQNVLNWTLVRNSDSSMGENNIFTYYGLQIGWANVDILYDYPGDRTQFTASLNTDAEIQPGQEMLLLIVQDFPSVINIYNKQGDNFVTNANAIPVGLNGALVGIALTTDNELLIGSTDITVAGDDNFTVDLAPGNINTLSSLLSQVSN